MNEKYLQFLGVRGVVGVAAHPDHGGGLPHPLPGALLPRRLQPPAAPHQPLPRQLGQGGVETQTVVVLFYILTHTRCVQIEGRISAAFYSQWSAASLWPSNAIVRHGKDLFRAEGVVNAAEPGNTSHTRLVGVS